MEIIMANTVYMLRGLPGADFQGTIERITSANPANYAIISASKIDSMLGDGVDSSKNGSLVRSIYSRSIEEALKAGKGVILNDTNLDPLHLTRIRKLLEPIKMILSHEVNLIPVNIETPLNVCIENDLKNPNSLGASRIKFLYRKYISPFPGYLDSYHKTSDELPPAVIIDLDSTVAYNPGVRGWYEDERVYEDEVKITPARFIAAAVKQEKCRMIFITGRNELKSGKCRDLTDKWIREKLLPVMRLEGVDYDLHMRSYNDMREDNLVKQDLYRAEVKDKYNVLVVFEDRDRVCAMYRQEGLVVFQVAEGDY